MAKKELEEKVAAARKKSVEVIVKMMEDKGLSWVQEWGNAFGKDSALPRNGISNRWYAGGNVLHLLASAMVQGFTDPRWFTYNQAKDIGYFPRKGEKATLVEYHKPMTGMKDKDGNWTRNEDEAVEKFRYYALVGKFYVFNAEQFADEDGNPMPKEEYEELEGPELDEFLSEAADCLITTSRCVINERKGETSAFYRPATDSITLPHRTQFTGMETFIGTLTHEMTHSTSVPLMREAKGRFGSEEYAFEELVAELGSVFCCLELGIHRPEELEADENFKNHAAYLKSWLKALRNDKDFLFSAAGHAARAATYIMGRYYGEDEETKEDAA